MDIIAPKYSTPKSTPRLQPLIDEAFGILAMNSSRVGKKTIVRALFSGGKDSITTAHLASHLPEWRGVGHVRTNTGPAAERHSDHSIKIAEQFGWDVIERTPSESLAGMVAQFGLPGPAAHNWMYRHLKERAIRKITSAARKPKERIVYATGIRRAESANRQKAATELTVLTDLEWWTNPIINWQDHDVMEYVNYFGLEVPSIGHSLDCFCGSYAKPEEREWLMIDHPDQYAYVLLLEDIAKAGHQIQVLEVKRDYRKSAFPEQFCKWGHGLNMKDIRADCKVKGSLCVNCDGKAFSDN